MSSLSRNTMLSLQTGITLGLVMITNWSPTLEPPTLAATMPKPAEASPALAGWLTVFSQSLTNDPSSLGAGWRSQTQLPVQNEPETEPQASQSDPTDVDLTPGLPIPTPHQFYCSPVPVFFEPPGTTRSVSGSREAVSMNMNDLFDSSIQPGAENSPCINAGVAQTPISPAPPASQSSQPVPSELSPVSPFFQFPTVTNVGFSTPMSGFEPHPGWPGGNPVSEVSLAESPIKVPLEAEQLTPKLAGCPPASPALEQTLWPAEMPPPIQFNTPAFQVRILRQSHQPEVICSMADSPVSQGAGSEFRMPSLNSQPTAWVAQVREAVSHQLNQPPESTSSHGAEESPVTAALPPSNIVAPAPHRDPAQGGLPTISLPESPLKSADTDDETATSLQVSELGDLTQHQRLKVSQPVSSSSASTPSRQLVNPILEVIPGATGSKIKTLTLHLLPDHLGKVEVTLSRTGDGNLNTHIVTETLEAHTQLGHGVQTLREALEQAGAISGQVEVHLHFNAEARSHHQFDQNQSSQPVPTVERKSGLGGDSTSDEETHSTVHLGADGLVSLRA